MRRFILLFSVMIFFLILGFLFYYNQQNTVQIGDYRVTYYVNRCPLQPESFPKNLKSLQALPGVMKIIWPGKFVSDGYVIEYYWNPDMAEYEYKQARVVRKKI